MIRVAQAGSNEWYGYYGGEAGDQRKGKPDKNGCFDGELSIKPWYSKPWTHHIRANDAGMAERIADFFDAICALPAVGYDQNQDETLWDECERLGWDLEKIKNSIRPCECDCCRLADVALRYAGLTVDGMKHWYTGSIRAGLEKAGGFTISTNAALTASDKLLRRGDLLLQEHHHIVCVLDTAEAAKDDFATMVMIKNCAAAYVRGSSSTLGKKLTTVHGGDICGFYQAASNGWAKICAAGTVGWVSGKYWEKMQAALITGNCWVRAGASTSAEGFFTVPNGTRVFLTGKKEQTPERVWYEVYVKGRIGWMSSLYCKPC